MDLFASQLRWRLCPPWVEEHQLPRTQLGPYWRSENHNFLCHYVPKLHVYLWCMAETLGFLCHGERIKMNDAPCKNRDMMAACSVVLCINWPFSSLYLNAWYKNSGRFHFVICNILEKTAFSFSFSKVWPAYPHNSRTAPASRTHSWGSSDISFFNCAISLSRYCTCPCTVQEAQNRHLRVLR
jgi:hypothetical protein